MAVKEWAKTGLSRSVLSQVPKCEAPGATIFGGCSHFSRYLGHLSPGAPTTQTQLILSDGNLGNPPRKKRRMGPTQVCGLDKAENSGMDGPPAC